MKHGTLTTKGNRVELRFERRLAHPPEKVWRALTDNQELAVGRRKSRRRVRQGALLRAQCGVRHALRPGQLVVPRGARISGRFTAGTRTLHAFGGQGLKRAES